MQCPALFSKANIGSLKVKNRLVMPPMVRNYADRDGLVTPRYVAHVERIARGGVGTMILEASYVRPDGKGFLNQLGIHDDAVVPGLRKLVAAAHKHGAVIGPQLYHAGRQTSIKITGVKPLAPSAVPDPSSGEMPEALDPIRIKGLVEAYAAGAKRAKAAGCDFVEIHGAHGYLITQFLSPFSNKRRDKYGGSLENRMRFLLEVVAAVRKEVGRTFPVTVRLSGDEHVDGGITPAETAKVAARLEKAGVDALHVSAGNYASYPKGYMIPPMAMPDGPLVPLAKAVKRAVDIPVIAVAKIRDPKYAEKVVSSGSADLVAIGRTLLADPDWPNKVREGRFEELNPCIACNQGCISRLFAQQDIWCTVNPEAGREKMFARPRVAPKTIVVIGGGPAGLSAARTAASRGHKVILYEKTGRLGGQLQAAAAAPLREGWNEFFATLVRDVRRFGVEVRLRRECTPADVDKDKADAVIVAIGSSPVRPKIPGVGRMHVVVARDVLEGRAKARGRVVVVGGGCAGAQTAEFLAVAGHPVTIIEASGNVAVDAPVDERNLLLGRLSRHGVRVATDTTAMSIGPLSVSAETPRGKVSFPANTVVLCLGSFPNDGLAADLARYGRQVRTVGDAVEARRVTDAVAEGALAALDVEGDVSKK